MTRYQPHYHPEHCALLFSEEGKDTVMFSDRINVFVCGALQNPDKMQSILQRAAPFAPAAVAGYKRTTETIKNAPTPFMVPSEKPNEILTGILWLDLSEQELKKIEQLELEGGYRKRIEIEVCVGHKRLSALTYVKR